MSKQDDPYLPFVLANTSNGYILTTFKIGTIIVEKNATDFCQFVGYYKGNMESLHVPNRTTKGKFKDVYKILAQEPITCLVRNPSDRLFSGLIQELLANSYSLKDLITSLSHSDSFREKVSKYFIDAIPVYWERLVHTGHCSPYHYPLHKFLDYGYVDNFTIKHIEDIKFEKDHYDYRHSNKRFLFPMYDAIEYLTQNSSEFSKKFTKFIDREWKYYQYLIDDQKKKDTENGQ